MKLLILCIDGFLDPTDPARPPCNLHMPYETSLTIPRELYTTHIGKVEDDGVVTEEEPSTLKIWASLFTGRILDDNLTEMEAEQEGSRYKIRKLLHFFGIRWRREKWSRFKKKVWFESITPNYKEKLVTDEYNSLMWNIPTICPEFIYHFPDIDILLSTRQREYQIWKLLAESLAISEQYDLGVIYFHLLDILGHSKKPLIKEYRDIMVLAKTLSSFCEVMVVSDHGTSPVTGHHTHLSYFGSAQPIRAESVLDVANEIRRVMNG